MANLDDQFDIGGFETESSAGFGSPSSSIRGTVRIDKTEYAVDLQWETASDPSRAIKEAKEYAASASDRPDFFCVRKGAKTQYGLGFASMGHKTNQPSLAAHICQNKGASFLALFEVDGGYYLLGVRDEMILSDFERFIDDQNEAINVFIPLTTKFEWAEIIAPENFEIEGARHADIRTVLGGRPSVRLKDMKSTSNLIRFGFLGLLAVGAVLGVRYYYDQIELQRIASEAQAQLDEAQRKVGLKEEEVKVPPMPWEGQVVGVRALETCFAEIMKFPTDVPGWDLSDLTCKPLDGGMVNVAAYMGRSATLEEGGAPVSYAMKMVKLNGLDPVLSMPSLGSAQNIAFQWGVPGLDVYPADLATLSISTVSDALLKVMEARRTSVNISPADSDEWRRGVTIEFTTTMSPLNFTDILGAIPGFLLEEVEYKLESNEYTIKGKAYEQLPIPKKQPA